MAIGLVCTFGVWAGRLHAQPQYRIVVAAFPDLDGSGGSGAICPGCDGQFTGGDAQRGNLDPLPALAVELQDGAGQTVSRSTTGPQSNGRQAVTFTVPAPAEFTVSAAAAPDGWQVCPGRSLVRAVHADDFDRASGVALVEFGFWRGCQVQVQQATATSETAGDPGSRGAVTLPRTMSDAGDAGAVADGQVGPGEVLGLVYQDLNRDKRLGADEPGIAGVVVRLTASGIQSTTRTTPAGNFGFTGLAPASYDVFIEQPEGWRVSTTDGYTQVRVNGAVVMGIDFGLVATAQPGAQVRPKPISAGVRLPQTGFEGTSPGRLWPVLAALTSVLGVLGWAVEQRRPQQA